MPEIDIGAENADAPPAPAHVNEASRAWGASRGGCGQVALTDRVAIVSPGAVIVAVPGTWPSRAAPCPDAGLARELHEGAGRS